MPTFYRVVHSVKPEPHDFMSNKAKNLPPRGPERDDADIYGGLSMYDTRERAEAVARMFPRVGPFVAEIATEKAGPGESLFSRKTLGTGHYTVSGDPDVFVKCVTNVWPVR